MSAEFDVIELSKYIINKCIENQHPINNLQLQKILYYIKKQYLKNNQVAFDDYIEAWPYGPVVPKSYYEFCYYGVMKLNDRFEVRKLNNTKIIDSIIEEKSELHPWKMVEDTYKPGGAWDLTYKNGKGYKSLISNDLITLEL